MPTDNEKEARVVVTKDFEDLNVVDVTRVLGVLIAPNAAGDGASSRFALKAQHLCENDECPLPDGAKTLLMDRQMVKVALDILQKAYTEMAKLDGPSVSPENLH